jgi:serine/threonine-protein kinase
MGVVYAAEDPSLGRRVALKTISHPDEESRQRFRREARAAASVSHPHACQIFEIGETRDGSSSSWSCSTVSPVGEAEVAAGGIEA